MKKEKLPKVEAHISPEDEGNMSNFTLNLRLKQFHLRWEQSKGVRDERNQKEKETREINFLPQGDR